MNTTLRSLVFAVVTAAAASAAPAQGLQWILNPATGNEYAVTPPMTWDAAATYAQSVGADLCWIGDLAENTWVADHFLSILPIYLGGTDLAIVRMRQFLLEMLRKQDAGEGVDGDFAGYRAEGNLPFSYEAPAGSDWRLGGQRGKLGLPVTA